MMSLSIISPVRGSETQKMGIATTIMDYARYNYIAQPGDENIRFVRQLGPYDDYAIEWGYRYFPGETSETEKVSLKKMVDAKSMNPMYMFGSFLDFERQDPVRLRFPFVASGLD